MPVRHRLCCQSVITLSLRHWYSVWTLHFLLMLNVPVNAYQPIVFLSLIRVFCALVICQVKQIRDIKYFFFNLKEIKNMIPVNQFKNLSYSGINVLLQFLFFAEEDLAGFPVKNLLYRYECHKQHLLLKFRHSCIYGLIPVLIP